MLRGFLVIFLLCTIAILAVFGFRGQTSTGPPLELFPDMVRQMKVRAQAPLNLFADGRGPRLPVAGTVPIGYEMPKPETADTIGGNNRSLVASTCQLQCRDRLLQHRQNGRSLGDRYSAGSHARVDGARPAAFQHHLCDVSWRRG